MLNTKVLIRGWSHITLTTIPTTAAAAPLQYLTGAGNKATPVVWLTWGVLLVSVWSSSSLPLCWRQRSGAGRVLLGPLDRRLPDA